MVAIRPEAIALGAPQSGKNALNAVVDEVSFLGSIVRIRTRASEQVLSLDVFNDPNQTLPQRGSSVSLNFSYENLLILE
jgi:putative spermidine/putrescine transport system ATP-binding protein